LSFITAPSETVLITNRLYRRGGDSTVTEDVTGLSPAACDAGKQAAGMP
jgi:hypothetical protein